MEREKTLQSRCCVGKIHGASSGACLCRYLAAQLLLVIREFRENCKQESRGTFHEARSDASTSYTRVQLRALIKRHRSDYSCSAAGCWLRNSANIARNRATLRNGILRKLGIALRLRSRTNVNEIPLVLSPPEGTISRGSRFVETRSLESLRVTT